MSHSELIRAARARRRGFSPQVAVDQEPFLLDGSPHPFEQVTAGEIPFVSTEDLARDVQRLASMLPPSVARIVGVARSGVCAASLLSLLLHRPLSIARQSYGDVVDSGSGWRLTGAIPPDGPIVLVDDTVMSGRSLHQCLPVVEAAFPGRQIITAAIYANPNAKRLPDLHVRPLGWPHLLEWNLFNSLFSQDFATDFDGVLCCDYERGKDYLEFLALAEPLYLPRRSAIPLIVTARLECYREHTLTWLERHGVSVERLVMGPWQTEAERDRSDVSAFKAEHYRDFLAQSRAVHPPLFVESCPEQAKRIAELSGGVVVCPAVRRVFRG